MGSGDYCDVVHSTTATYCHGSMVRRSRCVALDDTLENLTHADRKESVSGLEVLSDTVLARSKPTCQHGDTNSSSSGMSAIHHHR